MVAFYARLETVPTIVRLPMKFYLPIFCAAALLGQTTKVTIGDLNKLPARPPDKKIAYGPDTHQFGELRLPKGKGPHPVIVVIHGGCWGNFADADRKSVV